MYLLLYIIYLLESRKKIKKKAGQKKDICSLPTFVLEDCESEVAVGCQNQLWDLSSELKKFSKTVKKVYQVYQKKSKVYIPMYGF